MQTLNESVSLSAAADAEHCPRVSVVIPCYKGEKFLAAAIESCLCQTMTDFEVLIVDDASPDGCAAISERFAAVDARVRLIRHSVNRGVSEAFNTGFRAARGRYFTRLAQDDLFTAEALEALCRYLDSHQDVALVYCDFVSVDEKDVAIRRVVVPPPEEALACGNRIGLCVAWRREVWEAVGGFDASYDAAEDYEYWLRVWDKFAISKCEGPALLRVRSHAEMGSTRFADRQERATIRLLRECFPKKVSKGARFLLRSKAISYTLFSASADYAHQGHRRRALQRILKSFMAWPLPYRATDVTMPMARLRLLGALVLGRIGHTDG